MPSFHRFVSLAVLGLAIAPLACATQTKTEPTPPPDAPRKTVTSAVCADPVAFDIAVPFRKAFNVGRSVADGNKVYLSTYEDVFALETTPTGPATLTSIYHHASTAGLDGIPRADDVIVVDIKKVFSISKATGATTPLPDFVRRPDFNITGTNEVAIEGDTLYSMEHGETVTYFKHDLATGTETTLGAKTKARGSSLILGSDAIYSYYPTEAGLTAPSQLFKIAKSGASPANLTLTGAPSDHLTPIAFIGNDLFVFAETATGGTFLKSGPNGGAVTPLVTTTGIPDSARYQVKVFRAAGGLVLQTSNELFWLADGAAQATRFACVDGATYQLSGTSAVGKTLYANVVNKVSDEGGIVRIALP